MTSLNWPSKNIKTKVIYLDTKELKRNVKGKVGLKIDGSLIWLNTISKPLASNVICALSAFEARGYDLQKVNHLLNNLKFPYGRMEEIELSKKDKCFIDYAHTPQALKASLVSIKEAFSSAEEKLKIWCIFGCGGERDNKKRPLMAKIAERIAHHTVITYDNPRLENENKIIKEITLGFRDKTSFKVILKRKEAIYYCLRKIAKSKEINILLIAGKGHEEFQEINNKKIPFSDKDIVNSFKNNS